jgi:hypothetical protein
VEERPTINETATSLSETFMILLREGRHGGRSVPCEVCE